MEPHCKSCSCFPQPLKYGPVGDPNDADPWNRAQARVAEGWHVEGQRVGNTYMATTSTDRVTATSLDDLVAATHRAGAR